MTVYVDDMKAPFGRYVMCHCWADSRAELFAMMELIGVQTKWFQQPPKASWEHFDITMSKRKLAIQHGAVETDRYAPLEHTARLGVLAAASVGDLDGMVRAVRKMCMVGMIRLERAGVGALYDTRHEQ
jgi:hypothetical protein